MSHRSDFLQKAYDLGFAYERDYRGCSQCSVAALYELLGLRDDGVFKAATPFAGGGGLTGISVCGGYAGALLVLGQYCGREWAHLDDPEGVRFTSFALARKFTSRFIDEFGSIICRDLQTHIFGRPYYLADPVEFQRFEEGGGHVDKCTGVDGRSTRLAVQFFLDEGLIDLPPGPDQD